MKKCSLALTLIALAISACRTSRSVADVPPAPENPATATHVRLEPEDEWRIVFSAVYVLHATCSMMRETSEAYLAAEINHERMLAELEAETGFLRTSQEELAALKAPLEPVEAYLSRLEGPISVIAEVLAFGEEAVVEDEYKVWGPVDDACLELAGLMVSISPDALAAGLSQESLWQVENDAYDAEMDVYESTEEGRTAADVPTAVAAARPGETPVVPAGDQEQLVAAWRPAYLQGSLLFQTCMVTYETHADFGQGEIGLDRARPELETEARFVEIVLRGIISTTPQNEVVADHILKIEAQAHALTAWVDPEEEDIGTDAALETIGSICSSLQTRVNMIVADARSFGLSDSSLGALDADIELNEMIEDLYNLTIHGR